jgi:excisionase family DNA binding protein
MKRDFIERDVERSIAVNLRANRPPLSDGQIRSALAAMRGALVGGMPAETNTARAISQAEAARLLSCSRWSVRRLVATGKLRPVRLLGGLVRFDRQQVEQLLTQPS